MTDPNDFVDKNTAEGEEVGNPKAGQDGVGGLTTEEAEDSYKNAADQHFKDDTQDHKQPSKEHHQKQNKGEHTLPQIGSIEDDEQSVD